MGSCCEGSNNDYDIINLRLEKDKKSKKNGNIELQNQTDYDGEIKNSKNSNTNEKNISSLNYYISKKKLKIIIKQSKYLMEGKEYLINSLGLINQKNNYNDGLVIFGDTNVINNKYNIFENIDK